MKSRIYKIAVAFVLILGITACSKTTKGKFTNEWKATQFEVNYNYNGESGYTGDPNPTTYSSFEKVDGDRSSYSVTGDYGSSHGSIQQFDLKINKDGSYSETIKFTATELDSANNPYTENYTVKIEGTWSFMSKNKSQELKKNERVHFNPTKFHAVTTSVMGNSNFTYSGANIVSLDVGILIPGVYGGRDWTIDESTHKKLVLKTDQGEKRTDLDKTGSNAYENNDNYKVTMSITFEKK